MKGPLEASWTFEPERKAGHQEDDFVRDPSDLLVHQAQKVAKATTDGRFGVDPHPDLIGDQDEMIWPGSHHLHKLFAYGE